MAKKKAANRGQATARKKASLKRRSVARTNSRKELASSQKRKQSERTGSSTVRSYSIATIKELFALSGNQCAFPNCTNGIVAPAVKLSKAAIVGYICHIYAAADNGPRGKPGLTPEEKNSPTNLILMCGHHHPQVDKQWEDYPAGTLLEWKRIHEAKLKPGTLESIKREEDIQKHAFVEQMSDQQIERAIWRVRQGRYFFGFPTKDEALALSTQVERSKYSGGSDEVRARALAWCSRILSQGETLARAKDLLEKSKALATTQEAKIAQAFILAGFDKDAALQTLSKVATPESRSASLRIMSNNVGLKESLDWIRKAGLTAADLDAEGKLTLIMNALQIGEWETAKTAASEIKEVDYLVCPSLLHAVAMAKLLNAIPEEFRFVAQSQVPFEADSFLLSSSIEHLALRREAQKLFAQASKAAQGLGVTQAYNAESDYALWLALRDPANHDAAIAELQQSMRDPETSLRRINLALRFGLKLDIDAIEARIDQSVALSGKGTVDEAYARLSLAFAQGSHKQAADYIDKHRRLLYAHLHKDSIQCLEIEMLARAGLVSTAKERLASATKDGLPQPDQKILARIIAEASGADPVAERRAAYNATPDLRSLVNLVDALLQAGLWQDLLPYTRKLFDENPSAESCERIAHCLNELSRFDELFECLTHNQELVGQSHKLQLLWAWALYRDGRFADADRAWRKLPDENSRNVRLLRINIAIASGAWDQLNEYCNQIWSARGQYSALDLLEAAELSIAVSGRHSRDLLVAAAEKEPDSADVLAGAYFRAVGAGLEQDQVIAGWLNRAAQLSGENGPLKRVSLKDLVEEKPKWDERAASVWNQLRDGKVPTFAAAQLLNRSLLDFYLLPSLINPTEVDIRKRNVIPAYSGARHASVPQSLPTSLGLDPAALITLVQLQILDKVVDRFEILLPHSTLSWLFQERQRATFHQPSRVRDAEALKALVASGAVKVLQFHRSTDIYLDRQVGAELAAMLSSARQRTALGTKTLVVRSSPIHRVGSLMEEEADIQGYQENICSCSAIIDWMKTRGALTQEEERRARSYLTLHERPWPGQPSIDGQTELYLDGLSILHLQMIGVLGKLKAIGSVAYIDQSDDEEANVLVLAGNIGEKQLEIIDRLRNALSMGFAKGRVRAIRTPADTEEEDIFKQHPTIGVLGLVGKADAIVVDDRFANRYPTITAGTVTVPIFSTLDILAMLQHLGDLTAQEVYAHRTTLRLAGYQLIPLSDDELRYHLGNTSIVDGNLVEIAELRAIRESLLRARLSALIQLPGETGFLHQTLGAYMRVMKDAWLSSQDRAELEALSDYLLAQVDVRKWAPSAIVGNERGFAVYAYAAYVLQIISAAPKADGAARNAYYEWVTDRLLAPIKEYQREVYQWIVARSRELVAGLVDDTFRQFEANK